VLDLIAPNPTFHLSWLAAHREWGPGQHEDGFGLGEADEIDTADGFAVWIGHLGLQADCTFRWIVDGSELLGGIALRHKFTDFVARVGHIGYGVRPSARGRGIATWALGRILDEARTIGLDQLLVVCERGNIASASVIEHHGGVLEEAEVTEEARRYWINLRTG
jgi:RimJ/RimL family protein N-acetyltransferase